MQDGQSFRCNLLRRVLRVSVDSADSRFHHLHGVSSGPRRQNGSENGQRQDRGTVRVRTYMPHRLDSRYIYPNFAITLPLQACDVGLLQSNAEEQP